MVMSGVSDSSRVRMSGPVVEFMDDLVRELQTLGYATTTSTSTELMRLAAHLSRWLQGSRLDLADLTSSVIDAFVVERRKSDVNLASAQGLDPILGYLRRVGAVPAPRPVLPKTAAQVTLAGFAEHLTCERGLSSPVAAAYAHWVRPFVEQQLCPAGQPGAAGRHRRRAGRVPSPDAAGVVGEVGADDRDGHAVDAAVRPRAGMAVA